jgi:hypothetical protein
MIFQDEIMCNTRTLWTNCCLLIHRDNYCLNNIYVVGSKSFQPDQVFKLNQLCYFSIWSPFISTHFSYLWTSNSVLFKNYYISLAKFYISRSFCTSGQKLLDPTTYMLQSVIRKCGNMLCETDIISFTWVTTFAPWKSIIRVITINYCCSFIKRTSYKTETQQYWRVLQWQEDNQHVTFVHEPNKTIQHEITTTHLYLHKHTHTHTHRHTRHT